MPTPTGWSPTKLSDLSLDANAKALVYGEQWASNTISYSFPTASSKWSTNPDTGYGPSDGSGEPWNGFSGLSEVQRALVKDVLATWSAVADIRFVEVTETNSKVGDLRFAFSALDEGTLAQTYTPGKAASAGDVWLNSRAELHVSRWEPGSYEYMAMVHEIGHALGLKHPFEASGYNDVVAPPAWDTRSFTVMSYAATPGQPGSTFTYEPTAPMLLDIRAIQHLYGANMSWHVGNDTYQVGAAKQALWDAGGTDTIIGYGKIDLREGHASGNGDDNLWIAYGTLIENAVGGDQDDAIFGNDADNRLDGGGGWDQMTGGNGSDTYVVDDPTDLVFESAGSAAGHDTVLVKFAYYWDFSYTLRANVEDCEIINGPAEYAPTYELNGNELNNRFVAGGRHTTLNGKGGVDTVDYSHASLQVTVNLGKDGQQQVAVDSVHVLRGFENLVGTRFDDRLTGNAGANRIEGGRGNDILDGGAGNDTLVGGLGNDLYVVNSTGDVIVESSPNAREIDAVRSLVSWALGANLENLALGGAAAIDGNGNALANTLTGNAADNVLNGGSGADTMIGGRGNDTYVVDAAGDVVTETSTLPTEIDTVLSSVTRVLGSYQEVLKLTGAAAIDGAGNTLANTLTGNAAANVLRGGAGDDTLVGGRGNDTLGGGEGSDTMVGGLGNDTYYVDDTGDVVTEVAPSAAEIDTVISSVSRVLGNYQEWLTLTGTAAIDGTGNRSDNVLVGNIAANVLNGGMGNDVLAGGRGNDTLTGGAGLDTFRFTTLPHSTANVDIVNDFLSADDRIELDDAAFTGIGPVGALAASRFYIGAAAHDATDRIVYNQAAGKLYFDADGSGAGSQVLFATVTPGTALTVNDLFVI